jgi:hypothetical protein
MQKDLRELEGKGEREMRATGAQKRACESTLRGAYENEQLTLDELSDRLDKTWVVGVQDYQLARLIADLVSNPELTLITAQLAVSRPAPPPRRRRLAAKPARVFRAGLVYLLCLAGLIPVSLWGENPSAAGWQTALGIIGVFGGLIGLVAWTCRLVDRW